MPPRRHVAFYLLATVVIAAMVFALAATNVLLAQGSFRLDSLTQEQDVLTQQNGQLRLQVADLSTPGRIAQEAKQLGLQLPSRIEIVQRNGSRELTSNVQRPTTGTTAPSPAPSDAPAPQKPGGTG